MMNNFMRCFLLKPFSCLIFLFLGMVVSAKNIEGNQGFSGQTEEVTSELSIIHAGRVIDPLHNKVLGEVTIVIEKDKIKEVIKGYIVPKGARVIDLSRMVVLPGLIDCHKHLSLTQAGPNHYQDLVTRTSLDVAFQAVNNARLTLLNGFTSVRDVGGHDGVDLSLKRAISEGIVIGPRLWVAGEPISPTGGHFDFASGVAPDISSPKWSLPIADGVEGVLRAVRWRHRNGVDLIKIMPSGGVGSVGTDPKLKLMTDEEIKTAIEAAHSLGLKVAAHAHGKEAIDCCIRYGVDSIEHGTYADDESLAMMKEKGIFLVPTVYVARLLIELSEANPPKLPPHIVAKIKEVTPVIQKMFVNAVRKGVKIACGTDTSGNFRTGSPAKEIVEMVNLGLQPMEAIISATVNAAELMGKKGQIGSLVPGSYADIIAVETDPLQDITALEKVEFVMKAGVVYKEPTQSKDELRGK